MPEYVAENNDSEEPGGPIAIEPQGTNSIQKPSTPRPSLDALRTWYCQSLARTGAPADRERRVLRRTESEATRPALQLQWSIVPPHVKTRRRQVSLLVRSRAHSGLLCAHSTRLPRARASAVGRSDAFLRRGMRITSNAAPRTSAQARSGS